MPLPKSQQAKIEAANQLVQERAQARKGSAEAPNTRLPANDNPQAGIAEQLKEQLVEKDKEIARLTQSLRVLQGKYNSEVK